MQSGEIDDEMLMAYADGELDADGMAAVEAAVAESEDVAVRLAEFFETRAALQDAYPAEPVSDELADKVRAMAAGMAVSAVGSAVGSEVGSGAAPAAHANVVSLADRRAPRAGGWQPMALAASLALAVGLGAGWMLGAGGDRAPVAQATLLDDPAVREALTALPAGESLELADGGEVRAIASYRDGTGALCREVEHDRADRQTLVAVVCHEAGQWGLRLVVAAAAEQTGYAPASSLEVLDSYLSLTGAGEPLSPEDEAAALAGLR
jgi:hypothetical protein